MLKHTCPCCGSKPAGMFLGQMGRLKWFRCRYCGMDFSKERK